MSKKPDFKESSKRLTCGLIMPISSIDGCSADHWLEVKSIIVDAVSSVEGYDFDVKLVSDQDDVGVIQKRIVQNIYSSDIVICDVSCKNPNVMFELGMRLAFDKSTVIIKDDKTDYSFDTGVIEHIPYPRDLRFSRVVNFKTSLAAKLVATYKASIEDPGHSTFLKNFGTFRVASLDQKELSEGQLIIEMINDLAARVSTIQRGVGQRKNGGWLAETSKITIPPSLEGSVKRALQHYVSDKRISPVALLDLQGNDGFYMEIESLLAPSIHFENNEIFRRIVNQVMIDEVI